MAAATIARLTVAVCLLAAVIEIVLGCTSTTSIAGLTPDDALIVLFFIGPCLLMALFARRQRNQLIASWVLLAVAVGMSAWGLYAFGQHSYRYHTDPEYRMVQPIGVFVVALAQWAVVLVVGLALCVRWLISRRGRSASSAEQIRL